MDKIRVLIVDDSAVIRRLLSDLLKEDPQIEVVGMAGNGELAISKVQQLHPDIITLDMEMPVMDGIETLKALRKTHLKLPIIMFSTLTERGSSATMEALSLGASDYVTKPANVGSVIEGMGKIRDELIPKIKALCGRKNPAAPAQVAELRTENRFARTPRTATSSSEIDILAIGVSTGGPNALAELMPALGKNFPVPVVIVQHMPPLFTRLLAERLGAISGFKCQEGVPGQLLRPGQLWVAPGGYHMETERVRDGVILHLHEERPENSCRPAVDVLFRSVAKSYGSKVLSVILTGMGQDGLRGCEAIAAAGGHVLVQDEASSVVWGMPGAVSNAGLADKVLPLKELAPEILKRIQASASAPSFRPFPPLPSTVP
jgi:two-component system, chemotaxis family, protein-glutamate methylesterase/glutaminase